MEKENHKTRPRSSYHNVKSYDDELEIVRELIEKCKPFEEALNDEYKKLLNILVRLYEKCLAKYSVGGINQKEINKLIKSLSDGKVSRTELSETLDEIKHNIRVLQTNIITSWLIIGYELTKEKTGQSIGLDSQSPTMVLFSQPQKEMELITSSWCPDNKTYIDRVIANTEDMDEKLRIIIIQGLQRGWSKERMSQIFQNITGVAAYKADRLIRTETMAVWSKVTKEMFLEEGIEYVEIIGDAACGGICNDYVGEVIPLKEAELGDDLPPYHPNCCCSFCSYTEFVEKNEYDEDNFE